MLPLDWMMAVLNDPTASAERRDQMAIAAAPYFHAKIVTAGRGPEPLLDGGAPLVGRLVVQIDGEARGTAEAKAGPSASPAGAMSPPDVAEVVITPPLGEGVVVDDGAVHLLTDEADGVVDADGVAKAHPEP
jgi:hypothetical protein